MYHLAREQADEKMKATDHLGDIAFILHQFL